MASGELYISVFTNYIMMEMFKKRGSTKTLVKKNYEDLTLPLEKLTKVDLMGFEKTVASFIAKSSVKKGKVFITIFGSRDVVKYEEIDLGTDKPRDMKTLLPFEIDAMGDAIKGFKIRREFVGSVAKLHLIREEVVNNFSAMGLPKNWELQHLLPGYMVSAYNVNGSGIVIDVDKKRYSIYAYENWVLKSFDTNSRLGDYDSTRPENPDISYLIDFVSDDVSDYMINYRLSNLGVETTDTVTVMRNSNVPGYLETDDSRSIQYIDHLNRDDKFDVDSTLRKNGVIVSSVVSGINKMGKSLYTYDFSPEKMANSYKNLLVASMSFTLISALVLPGVSYWSDIQIEKRHDDVSNYKQTLLTKDSKLVELKASIEESDKTIEDYNAYVSSLESLNNVDRNFISKVLGYLPDNTPSSVYVESISLTKGTKSLVLKGVSNNYKDIGSFAIQLEKFGGVKINTIDKNVLLNMDGYPFEIELKSNK